MKELTLKEEVESALALSERFFVLFFRHSEKDAESVNVKKTLEAIEIKRDEPRMFFFVIDGDRCPDASLHLAGLTKMAPEIPQCMGFFDFRPHFMLSKQEITEEKLESLIPDVKNETTD